MLTPEEGWGWRKLDPYYFKHVYIAGHVPQKATAVERAGREGGREGGSTGWTCRLVG